jgi:hypothetical protein
MKPINAFWGQNAELLNIMAGDTHTIGFQQFTIYVG